MTRRIANFTSKVTPVAADLSLATTSIDELTLKTLEILRREVLNLMGESTAGKLSPQSSTALVSYIKLLGELKEQEKDLLDELSNKHLQEIAGKE